MPKCPNILLITADQLRADALGCYGNEVCKTPNIDALAASGVLFENAFTPNPICVPARASITTGNYPHRATGNKDNAGRIQDDQPKLAEHFASHGYHTHACGKLHYVPYSPPGEQRLLHGFQHCDLSEESRVVLTFDPQCQQNGLEDYIDYLAENGWKGYSRGHGVGNNDVRPCPSPLPAEHNVDHWVADRTIARITEHVQHNSDQPFLMWCSFIKPHSPYDPPFDWAQIYDPREMPPASGNASMLLDRNPEIQETLITHAMDSLGPQAHSVIRAYYYALISFQDAQLGRVIKALEACGQAENTIIIYTADHGDLLGDFGAYFKMNFMQGSVRVPMIIKPPGMTDGQRRSQLVGLQDILPSLAALTGRQLPQQVQGVDLSAALGSDTAKTRELFYAQCSSEPRQAAMICDASWKYCYAQKGPTEELYNLKEDPHELMNLASGPNGPELIKPWRERLIQEARKLGDNAILNGKGLCATPLDRTAITQLPVQGMGWRWY